MRSANASARTSRIQRALQMTSLVSSAPLQNCWKTPQPRTDISRICAELINQRSAKSPGTLNLTPLLRETLGLVLQLYRRRFLQVNIHP